MKTKNIFRMLLVAATLLLGANNMKAGETIIWQGTYDPYNAMAASYETDWYSNLQEGDKIRVYLFNTQIFINGSWNTSLDFKDAVGGYITSFTSTSDTEGYFDAVFTSSSAQSVSNWQNQNLQIKIGSNLTATMIVFIDTDGNTKTLSENSITDNTFSFDPTNGDLSIKNGMKENATIRIYVTIGATIGKLRPYCNNSSVNLLSSENGYEDCTISEFINGYKEFSLTASNAETLKTNLSFMIKADNIGMSKYSVITSSENVTQKQNSSITFSGNGNESVEFGNTFTAPTVTTTPENASLTYESSDEKVAKIINGSVVPVGAGNTTIKAQFEGNDTYYGTEATYNLTVTAPTTSGAVWQDAIWLGNWGEGGSQPILPTNDTFKAIKSGDKLILYGKMGPIHGTNFNIQLFQLNNEGSWGTKFVDVSQDDFSSTEGCFIINIDDNNVNSFINGLKDNVNGYCAAVNGYNFTITAIKVVTDQAPADTRADVTLAFSASTGSATVGETPTNIPTLTATSNGETVSGLAITYTSSNTSVAQVDTNTGAITPVAAGSTTITASFAGDTNYKPAQSVSYTLTVNAAQVTPEYITVDMGSYEYRTYVTTTNIDFSQSIGINGYYATGLTSDGTKVQFRKVTGVVAASVPLLLQKVSGATEYKLLTTDTSGSVPSPNKLVAGGTNSWISGSNIFVLTVHNGQLVFAETNINSANVNNEHAYLNLRGSNARSLMISFSDDEDEATEIDAIVSNEQDTQDIYDLRGLRVQKPTKGVYIINGKKMVIK